MSKRKCIFQVLNFDLPNMHAGLGVILQQTLVGHPSKSHYQFLLETCGLATYSMLAFATAHV